jgi:hypothetical protein
MNILTCSAAACRCTTSASYCASVATDGTCNG